MADVRMTTNRWAALAAEAVQQADDVTELFAGMMESSAAIAAPYEFGILQESVAVEGASAGAAMARRRIVVGAFYGLFQHEGTDGPGDGIDPNPFLTDAVEYWKADYLAAISLVAIGGW